MTYTPVNESVGTLGDTDLTITEYATPTGRDRHLTAKLDCDDCQSTYAWAIETETRPFFCPWCSGSLHPR
jgi:hypothetical protein